MEMSMGFPEQFVSISTVNNAGLPRQVKSLVMASSQKRLKFEGASAHMRRLFGSRGDRGRQDGVLTGEGNGSQGGDEDLEAWVAYRKAKERGAGKKKQNSTPRRGEAKREGTDRH